MVESVEFEMCGSDEVQKLLEGLEFVNNVLKENRVDIYFSIAPRNGRMSMVYNKGE